MQHVYQIPGRTSYAQEEILQVFKRTYFTKQSKYMFSFIHEITKNKKKNPRANIKEYTILHQRCIDLILKDAKGATLFSSNGIQNISG